MDEWIVLMVDRQRLGMAHRAVARNRPGDPHGRIRTTFKPSQALAFPTLRRAANAARRLNPHDRYLFVAAAIDPPACRQPAGSFRPVQPCFPGFEEP